MKVLFKHKDQEFFKEVCNLLPSFEKRFQEACKAQWKDHSDYIFVARNRDSIDFFHWSFNIPKKDIERVEDLEPFTWYPASKWNGNPEKHMLVERDTEGEICTFRGLIHRLASDTEFFMLAPKNKDIKPKC